LITTPQSAPVALDDADRTFSTERLDRLLRRAVPVRNRVFEHASVTRAHGARCEEPLSGRKQADSLKTSRGVARNGLGTKSVDGFSPMKPKKALHVT
jgi:hypothetical protein